MTEKREFMILIAATILAALRLAAKESDRPSPAKFSTVDRAIELAKFILDRIDQSWPQGPSTRC